MKITTDIVGSRPTVVLDGSIDARTIDSVQQAVFAAFTPNDKVVVADFAAVKNIDTIGLAGLVQVWNKVQEDGRQFRLKRVPHHIMHLFELMQIDKVIGVGREKDRKKTFVEWVVGHVKNIGGTLYALFDMMLESLYWIIWAPIVGKNVKTGLIVRQIVQIGFDSIPIVFLIMFLFGLVMAMMPAKLVDMYGGQSLISAGVAVSLVRELGPLLTAIILAARSGSAFAAEIGTMQVTEEIDAMRTMAISPANYLIAPRVIGLVVSGFILTLLAIVIGGFGAWMMTYFYMGVPTSEFMKNFFWAIDLWDLTLGLSKAIVFSFIVAVVGCFYGFRVRGSADAVGQATTSSVVLSIQLVIVSDALYTIMPFFLGD